MKKDNDKRRVQKPDAEQTKAQELLSVPSKQALLAASGGETLPPPSDASEDSKLKEYENLLKRLQAEFENYKKRVAKENEQRALFEGEGLVLKLLPFLDDMDAALEAAEKNGDAKLREGIDVLRAKLLSILGKSGLSEMKCEGEQFDPYRHEAVIHEPSERKENEIVRVVRKGYLFRGKVIRHAIVSVSNGKKPEFTGVQA